MLVHAHDVEGAGALGQQVAVCQHDALGIAGGARRVEDDRGIVEPRRAGRQRRRRHVAADHPFEAGRLVGLAVQQHDAALAAGSRAPGAHGLQVLRRGEEHARARIAQQRVYLGRLVGRVERHRDGAAAQDPEVRRAPVGVVVRKDGAAFARTDANHRQPRRRALGHLAQPGIGEAVEVVLVLDLDGGAPGVALGRPRELFEEILHAAHRRATRARERRRAEVLEGEGGAAGAAMPNINSSVAVRPSRSRAASVAVGRAAVKRQHRQSVHQRPRAQRHRVHVAGTHAPRALQPSNALGQQREHLRRGLLQAGMPRAVGQLGPEHHAIFGRAVQCEAQIRDRDLLQAPLRRRLRARRRGAHPIEERREPALGHRRDECVAIGEVAIGAAGLTPASRAAARKVSAATLPRPRMASAASTSASRRSPWW